MDCCIIKETYRNTFFVRLAHSYSVEELPCRTLEKAVAAELVYSVWIRRRDAHIDNRVYVKGIPIFFDFDIAFLGERNLTDINLFFSQDQDHGRAGLWRVKTWSSFLTQFTGAINNTEIGAYHYVNDLDLFYHYVEESKKILKASTSDQLDELVHKSNFDSVVETEIVDFLRKNLDTLDTDINKMFEIIV